MKVADLLPVIHLPDLIATHWGYEAVRGLHPDRGGVICDRRPGQEETHPSFSVYKHSGIWRWKRHGGDGASGNAYGFLLELGSSEQQAREELHRLAGMPLNGWQAMPRPQSVYTPPSALKLAQDVLARCAPLTPDERVKAARLLAPLAEQDQAAQDLQARGLYGWAGLEAHKLRRTFQTREGRTLGQAGALAFMLTGPDGQARGLKVRNLGSKAELAAAGLERYVYRLAGHGAPAWCSPGYGKSDALMIVEGELNGAAAARAGSVIGLSLDVQGLAGAGGVPYLEGMAGRTVYLSFDADEAGRAGFDRVARIAQEAGAVEVRVLPSLPVGDFCEELGRWGAAAFGEQLRECLKTAELWQSGICGKSGPPQIKASPSAGKIDLWQCGSTSQGWAATDGSWGLSRGGW